MDFGLDVRPSLSRPTGVGTYVLGLAEALPLLAPDDRFHYFSASVKERYPARAWPPNVRLVDRRLPVRGLNRAWNRLGWPSLDRLVGTALDLVHSPTPLLIPSRRGKRVVTVHDLFFLKHPDMVEGEVRRDYVALVRDHVRRADGVLCVSEYTASEVRRLLEVPEEKIAVTPHGVDPFYRDGADRRAGGRGASTPAAARAGHSSTSGAGRSGRTSSPWSWPTSPSPAAAAVPPLVLAGPGSDWAQGGSRVGPQILATGYLDKPDVRALMAASALLVLPSLEEGFGLPVVEAMAAGLPVVCSAGSALAEVAGDAACLVDAHDPERARPHASSGCSRTAPLAQDLRRRGLERSRRFDWKDTAARTLAFYRRVLGQ